MTRRKFERVSADILVLGEQKHTFWRSSSSHRKLPAFHTCPASPCSMHQAEVIGLSSGEGWRRRAEVTRGERELAVYKPTRMPHDQPCTSYRAVIAASTSHSAPFDQLKTRAENLSSQSLLTTAVHHVVTVMIRTAVTRSENSTPDRRPSSAPGHDV